MSIEKTVNCVPHQKLIIVNKAVSNKKNLYCILNLKALDRAVNVLQSTARIKLYLYFAKNQDKYFFALSSKHFKEWAGVGKTAYDTAIAELIEKGYLVHKAGTKNTYDFYEDGEDRKIGQPKDKEKSKDGFEF